MLNNLKLYLKLFLIISLTVILFYSESRAAMVEGIVITPDGPLANARVFAYRDFSSLAAGSNSITSQPGEKTGQFKLELTPGKYYFIARGSQDDRKMYSYHGLNPVSIPEDYLWLPFFAVESSPLSYLKGPQGIGG